MDTKTAAVALGTEPRVLRRFLRDPSSGYSTVGSGARYDFEDLETLTKAFTAWRGTRPTQTTPEDPRLAQEAADRLVWDEEEQARAGRGLGPVVLEDLRDPKVRARVRRIAAERDRRLEERLLATGMHITQMGRRS